MYAYNHDTGSVGGYRGQDSHGIGDSVPPPPPPNDAVAHVGGPHPISSVAYGYEGYYPYPSVQHYAGYIGGYGNVVPADAIAPSSSATPGIATSGDDQLESVQRCHKHTKPDLNCKFCRKYKSAVHELSRLAAQKSSPQQSERPNQLPMTNTSTYNLNTMLRNNILNSEYYKSLATMNSHLDILNELVQYADHAEPYCSTATRAPSTLFCCLHKLFTMKLTEKQMVSFVDCRKSPYPRCCGFLYLRFVLPSDDLWDWFEPYFMDDESFVVSVNPSRSTTIGEFCERLLVDEKYFNTVLPRLPVRFKNRYGAQLYAMSEHRRRRVRNLDALDAFAPGERVFACIRGDWVEAEIESVGADYPVVNLALKTGEKESVDIGYVSLSDPSKAAGKRSRDESSRSRSPSGERGAGSKDDLLRKFKQRQQEKALAVGKDYAKRPSSFKSSLSSKMDHKHGR